MELNFFDKNQAIICFLRHGQTDWNVQCRMQGREEVPLNDAGIAQAYEAASGLKAAKEKTGLCWDKIITSPLERAKTTAMIAKEAVECENFIIDDRLLERDFGALSGTKYDDYSKAVFDNVPEISSIETVESLIERVNALIKDRVSVGERVIFVTHGAVTRVFASNAKKSDIFADEKTFGIGNCHVAIYSYDGKNPVLQAYDIPCDEISELVNEKMEEK